MAEMFRVLVWMTSSSSVNGSKAASCAGGVEASELKLWGPFASRTVPRFYPLTRILI